MIKKIYIAGAMTGYEHFNRNAFKLIELYLISEGFEVRSPACLPITWSSHKDYLDISLKILSTCDFICVLPDSCESEGTKKEIKFAMSQFIAPIKIPYDLSVIASKLMKMEKLN